MTVRGVLRRPAAKAVLAVGVVGAVAGLWWFQPHKLFFDTTVDEDLPGRAPAAVGTPTPPDADRPGDAPSEADPPDPPELRLLASGDFRDLGRYETNGAALIYELEDGSRVLRLEDFETTNGPDLRVWLSAAPAESEGREYADDHIDLGVLRGNIGNQNYEIPDGVDLDVYQSVVIWCRRFTVGFGSAPLL